MKTYQIKPNKFFTGPQKLGEVLHKFTSLDDKLLSDAAFKGAVWLQKGGKGKILRIRSLQTVIKPEDLITFYHDPKVLALPELKEAICLYENNLYGVWIKPVGIMSQGTQTGDHASILRYVEKLKNKQVYMIHRLDRETEGPMLIGYESKASGILSELFTKKKIRKVYQAIVLGEMTTGLTATIKASLDDKEAITHYRVLDSRNNKSLLEIEIETGRLHQIRRHLDLIGHPIMGDPKYGKGNKNKEGLKLLAYSLSFEDPWDKKAKTFHLEKDLSI